MVVNVGDLNWLREWPGFWTRPHASCGPAQIAQCKKDSPEPPKLSLKPSRLEGQLDDPTVLRRCCKRIAEWWISDEFADSGAAI